MLKHSSGIWTYATHTHKVQKGTLVWAYICMQFKHVILCRSARRSVVCTLSTASSSGRGKPWVNSVEMYVRVWEEVISSPSHESSAVTRVIWGSRGGILEDGSLVRYETVSLVVYFQTFRSNLVPSSSGSSSPVRNLLFDCFTLKAKALRPF